MNKVLSEYYASRNVHDIALGRLDDATLRIVNVIKKVFKHKNAWWSYKFYHNSDDGPPLPELVDDGCFPIYISEACDSGAWYYNESFPVNFFDMTDEEIEKYIREDIKREEDKEKAKYAAEKLKDEERKAKKKKLIDEVAKKLTKEERKLLGIK